ncbi:putative arsenate oxidoreductase [Halobacteriovorax marinus SJ]|uniref:Arsenate oxidoreductase n=1 Tax=Halobacteriovorax marinus (strain ATCC BAA-682 / DSM 15412 / SJ) TaxID=862908 RepID=E1WZ08_HALMS|nr:arsenate reductase (glutaredoxin) [Halobacteriovorax marinus]CBW26105.1 putative arsenate oxidoreductase [Halobacteriovorax marinus SJ]
MLYYHNPRCSKSRQGLQLLNEQGIEPTIKEYLKEGLTQKEILDLMEKLSVEPLQGLIRIKDSLFKELGLSKTDEKSKKDWAKIISENPALLERPILVNKKKAIIGRPPEDLNKII